MAQDKIAMGGKTDYNHNQEREKTNLLMKDEHDTNSRIGRLLLTVKSE